jgi:hypothetical protein
MKVTKRQLKRIIREEKIRLHRRRMRECGEDMSMVDSIVVEPIGVEPAPALEPVMESENPEENVLVEMEVASRALQQVLESVQNAAHVCTDCGPAIAAQAPLMEAMVSQAEALQEMVEAQTNVLQENATAAGPIDFTGDVANLPGEEAFGLGYEAGKQGLG